MALSIKKEVILSELNGSIITGLKLMTDSTSFLFYSTVIAEL
jgi:hypothetical protein